MHKILIIAQREFLTRVRKKSFVIMTILSPLLLLVFYGVIFYLNIKKQAPDEPISVMVVDPTNLLNNSLPNEKTVFFKFAQDSAPNIENMLNVGQWDLVLEINHNKQQPLFNLYSLNNIGFLEKASISNALTQQIQQNKLIENGISPKLIQQINQMSVQLNAIQIKDHNAKANHSEMGALVGFIMAFVIYLFIFLYGVQVMKGAIEEKSSRIVEILVSSIKPTELMYGKILGIAGVGMTQFLIWVVVCLGLMGPLSGIIGELVQTNLETSLQSSAQVQNLTQNIGMEWLAELNLPFMFALFICYFIGGYLFYGALFAAVGAAVDNDTDTQQFMMPITMPLVFSLIYSQSIIGTNPDGVLTTFLSMLPFTSPVVMMVRIPYGVPTIELVTSLICLCAGFMMSVWFAGKIYSVGLLNYGNKTTYKTVWKMFRQRN